MIGFICPVYELDIPKAMKEFVEQLEINTKAYIFMIYTYIFIHGRAFETIKKIMIPITERKIKKISKDINSKKVRKYPMISMVAKKL